MTPNRAPRGIASRSEIPLGLPTPNNLSAARTSNQAANPATAPTVPMYTTRARRDIARILFQSLRIRSLSVCASIDMRILALPRHYDFRWRQLTPDLNAG